MVQHQINIIFKDKSNGIVSNQVKLHKFNNKHYNSSYGIKFWSSTQQTIKYYDNYNDMQKDISKYELNSNVSIHEYFKHKDENQLL